MKLLLVGDCHGELPDIPGEEFDAVLAVGDVCGGNDEARSAMFESIERTGRASAIPPVSTQEYTPRRSSIPRL
jgi:hypothetical protein